MGYRIAADSVLFAHFLFAAFAVFGGILVALNVARAWIHVPAVLWSALVNLKGWTCPLTPLEQVSSCTRYYWRSATMELPSNEALGRSVTRMREAA
jgi:hypothetical protein